MHDWKDSGKHVQFEMVSIDTNYQENRGNDIYVFVDMAAVTAKRGDIKWMRFWLFEWLQLQGGVPIPPNTKDGDIIKVERDDIAKYFSFQKIINNFNQPDAFTVKVGNFVGHYEIPQKKITDPSRSTRPNGDLYVVVRVKT